MSALNIPGSPNDGGQALATSAREFRTNLDGLFMWLPPCGEVSPENSPTLAGCTKRLDNGAYNHPVVILSSTASAGGTVLVLLMTSFGGHTLQDRIAKKHKKEAERLAESHIPIAPLKPHGPHNIVLHTSESRKLKKNCYINTEKLILVKLSVLQSYGSGTKQTQSHWAKRLQKSSLKILQRACLKNGDYQITLYPTFQALKPSLGVGRAVADDLSLRRVDMVSEIRSFGPVQHPRSSVKRPLLPSAGARHYTYASTTVPKAASQLSKSYHPARLYGRGGYGTVNGSRQSLPRYRSDRRQPSLPDVHFSTPHDKIHAWLDGTGLDIDYNPSPNTKKRAFDSDTPGSPSKRQRTDELPPDMLILYGNIVDINDNTTASHIR
ncbi:hypothetical protein MCOR05_010811 [Pyricularia oryzae]|nr:hypothetical protein MCOR05_010811 [Pyricularia oryzae]